MSTDHVTPVELDQKRFAALRGVDPALVTRWKAKGLLVMSADGKRVCVAESLALLDARLHPGRGGDRTQPGAPSGAKSAARSERAAPAAEVQPGTEYADWMAREKRANAQIAELKLAELSGQLVNRVAMAMAYAKRVAAARAELQALPRRLASLIVTDAGAAERAAAAKVRDICAALSDPEFSADTTLVATATLRDLRDTLITAAGAGEGALWAAVPRLRALCEALPQ